MSAESVAFGDLLRQHRRRSHLTQEELAELAGISARAISDLERGERAHPYRETAQLLAAALGLEGQPRQLFLAAAVRRAGTGESLPRLTHLEHSSFRLPRPRSALIGRSNELARIVHLLQSERLALVTITGPAGVGKTRLLLEAAANLEGVFADGLVSVDLAPLADQPQVVSAIAAALGVVDGGTIPLEEAIRRRLSRLRVLLLLDNFEHLLPVAPLVSNLLHGAPALQVLASSRAALRLEGEKEVRLAPLPHPDPGESIGAEDLLLWEAAQLFAVRAAAAQPGFRITDENAPDVATICRRLDGLPLAIELAAARIALLSPGALRERLDLRLSLLTTNRRDAPARQQTLEAAIDWSYGLLNEDAQALLQAMAVFADGWSLSAAESMGSSLGILRPLDALAALVEQNLVVRDDAGDTPRYRMLETIHVFARERLVTAGADSAARRAQLQHFIQFARENDIERLDALINVRLAALIAEATNLREAVRWALDLDPELALELLAELDYFWYLGDQHVVGRAFMARALGAIPPDDSWARGRVLAVAAWLASVSADYATATRFANEAVAVAERNGDRHASSHALCILGVVAAANWKIPEARVLHEAAIAQFAAAGDEWGLVLCTTNFGIAELDWGNLRQAELLFARVHDIARRLDLPESYHAHALYNLAEVFRLQGRLDEAMSAALEASDLSHHAVNRIIVAQAQFTLARLLLVQERHLEAIPLVLHFLMWAWAMEDLWSLTPSLEMSGMVLRCAGRFEAAASQFGAAYRLRTALPYPLGVAEREPMARELAVIKAALGSNPFQRAWQAGHDALLPSVVRAGADALSAVLQEANA